MISTIYPHDLINVLRGWCRGCAQYIFPAIPASHSCSAVASPAGALLSGCPVEGPKIIQRYTKPFLDVPTLRPRSAVSNTTLLKPRATWKNRVLENLGDMLWNQPTVDCKIQEPFGTPQNLASSPNSGEAWRGRSGPELLQGSDIVCNDVRILHLQQVNH